MPEKITGKTLQEIVQENFYILQYVRPLLENNFTDNEKDWNAKVKYANMREV